MVGKGEIGVVESEYLVDITALESFGEGCLSVDQEC